MRHRFGAQGQHNMDPQLQAILQALLGGANQPQAIGQMGFSQSSQLGGNLPGMQQQQPDDQGIMNFLNNDSGHLNYNPNFASTIGNFFEQNPMAGPKPFAGASPLQSGPAGNNAMRGGQSQFNSFLPNPASSMSSWTGQQ